MRIETFIKLQVETALLLSSDLKVSMNMLLGYGNSSVSVELQDGWEVVQLNELPPAHDGEIDRALDSPFGAGLEDLSGRSAAVIVSDITRPSPSHRILPPLVRRLRGIGVNDIKIVFALGTHRRMTDAEIRHLLRGCVRLPHFQHDTSRCVHLGETGRGTPVEIFDLVESSDLVIGTGNIEYHYYAGYSGGAKALLPGVSSERSIHHNHMMMREPKARSGFLDSPVRKDMEEAADIAGLDLILNVVLNSRKEIVSAVAGDYIKAHRAGAAVVDRMYLREVKPADIVITCAGGRPKDINLYQAVKALENAKGAAAPGGTIILLAECAEGLGDRVFERWARECSTPEECVERFAREYEFGGHKAAYIAELALRNNLVLVSSMPRDVAEMCFFKPMRSIEEALELAWSAHGRDARTVLIPHGDLTLTRAR